jgi:ribosomal protein S18 acetylase RimI-like enzyme
LDYPAVYNSPVDPEYRGVGFAQDLVDVFLVEPKK